MVEWLDALFDEIKIMVDSAMDESTEVSISNVDRVAFADFIDAADVRRVL